MKLKEFTRAPTPEPSQAVPKDVPEIPGQMTVDEVIADVEAEQSVVEVTPSGLEIFYQWAPKRLYRIRRADPSMGAREPLEVPSVTTVLNVLDKSGALTWWGQGVGAEGLLTLIRDGAFGLMDGDVVVYGSDGWLPVTREDVVAALTEHKLTVNHVKDQAADRGVNVHNALEQWTESGVIPSAEEWPEHEAGYVQGLAGLLEAIQGLTEGIQAEVMVGSLEYLYAGRYDLRLELKKPVEVVTKTYPKRADKVEEIPAGKYLLDLKTRKKPQVYPSNFMQLEAYEEASVESGYEPTDYRGVIVVTPDGKYQLSLNTDWQFEDFQVVRQAYSVMHERDKLRNEREVLAELEKLGAKELTKEVA